MSDAAPKLGLSEKRSSTAAESYFEFRNVCKAFDERPVLNNVSFRVKRGETCVIMGRSGVGKSVSLKRSNRPRPAASGNRDYALHSGVHT